jgi:ribosomal protein S18 acetylase RimI-like enzyme
VSNLPSGRDLGDDDRGLSPVATAALSFRPARRNEIHAALQLILNTDARPAPEEQVVDFLRFAIYRGIDLNDTWVAAEGDKVVWAILPVLSPGRTMLLFSPVFAPPHLKDTCICPLVERILDHYRGRAIDLAQVLIDPAEADTVRLYEACGFEPLAELIYLDREVRRATDAPPPPGFTWQSYSAAAHADFARTIAASYEKSLDCPRLNGRRQIEDVIAGHKAAGEFEPALWRLLRDGAAPVGVVLLNRSTRSESLELVYLGLVPSHRGRRLGDAMMRHALARTSCAGARRLTLAVDSTNAPALRLYQRHGMRRVCTRAALMRDMRDRAGTKA